MGISKPPSWPPDSDKNALSAHPFGGGESEGLHRLDHLVSSSAMTKYADTRNGLLGLDFSTKLSAYLALGCLTARQVHAWMICFEDGNSNAVSDAEQDEMASRLEHWKGAEGYGKGENGGTAGVRFELVWRDYIRLVTRKYGARLFSLDGLRGLPSPDPNAPPKSWRKIEGTGPGWNGSQTRALLDRFRGGRTGTGLIDASQRELFLTGYTSNRARQNVASFLAKHLDIDWRLGAEWYECMLVDYDVASNWGNWQYVAGVGNDPRQGRLFNPVKQALDYDKQGEYIKAWVPELRGVEVVDEQNGKVNEEALMGVFQAWRLPVQEKERLGLVGVEWAEEPLVRIPFSVGRKTPLGPARGRGGYRGRGRGRGRGWRGERGGRGVDTSGRSEVGY
jgi:deoxyribodipyrimidine photo-lyase